MWLFLTSIPVRAECPPAALAMVVQRVGEIKSAYVRGDLPAFDESATALVETLPCTDDPISPQIAVEIHHVMGLRAFANQDLSGAQRALSGG